LTIERLTENKQIELSAHRHHTHVKKKQNYIPTIYTLVNDEQKPKYSDTELLSTKQSINAQKKTCSVQCFSTIVFHSFVVH